MIRTLDKNEGGLDKFSRGYDRYGIHKVGDNFVYREWAPGAQCIFLFGDFNGWNKTEHLAKRVYSTLTQNDFGTWELTISGKDIPLYSKVKAHVKLANGIYEDRIPAWINFTKQNEDKSYDGVYVEDDYKFKHENPTWANDGLKIYECHIGMSGISPKVHSYTSFKNVVVDRVADLGYNAIQIMGVLEHPYYGSFGYHVSNFFAVSSRCGTPR